ncbi:MAG: tRNA (N6-threonylcarbamoyladenosine(37)-N6)-methyltransferase TrmO [bacterium]|nr:tRNA (N6-threonylcarbamoyladenosine(37)-N6)-methyltransferase TrmO [bacterium]
MYEIKSIGKIYTPYNELVDMPIQPNGAAEVTSQIKINSEYEEGLADLEGFSHIFLIYILHMSKKQNIKVVPFMDTVERGIFATRSPQRPNHIGLSIVRLICIKGNTIEVNGADVLNGTPLIDIKPYIKNVDSISDTTSGWISLNRIQIGDKRSDDRFV